MKSGAIFFAILIVSSALSADVECKGGGDSGTPFANISKEFQSSTAVIPTEHLIKDFFVRSNNELIYKDDQNTVWKSKNLDPVPVIQFFEPLSRIQDPWNSFVLGKNYLNAFNTGNHSWYRVGTKSQRGEDLYWSGSRVFSLSPYDDSTKHIQYAIHTLNGPSEFMGCKLSFPANVEMHIATGHTYPFLFLYTTEKKTDGVRVQRYALRLEEKKLIFGKLHRCELTDMGLYNKHMPGSVKALHHFGDLDNPDTNAWLMELDHPKKKFLWSAKDQCTFFDAPASEVLIPNPNVHVVAMTKSGGGVTLFYPGKEKSVDLLQKFVSRPLASENLWMTPDKRNLYVAAKPENENARLLLKVALDQVQ